MLLKHLFCFFADIKSLEELETSQKVNVKVHLSYLKLRNADLILTADISSRTYRQKFYVRAPLCMESSLFKNVLLL